MMSNLRIKHLDFLGFSKYAVRSDGVVINICRVNINKPDLSMHGYFRVTMRNDCGEYKKFSVHRLVALAFIPNPENKKCVNHKDSCRTNNCVDNLEWCTYAENSRHAVDYGNMTNSHRKKLSESDVRFIVGSKESAGAIARILGVSRPAVSYWRKKHAKDE